MSPPNSHKRIIMEVNGDYRVIDYRYEFNESALLEGGPVITTYAEEKLFTANGIKAVQTTRNRAMSAAGAEGIVSYQMNQRTLSGWSKSDLSDDEILDIVNPRATEAAPKLTDEEISAIEADTLALINGSESLLIP